MKNFVLATILFFNIGLAETFDPTKLPKEKFAVIANIMGMTTVFVVLTILSLIIAFTGKILTSLEKRKEETHVKEVSVQTIIKEPLKSKEKDDEEIAAAIFASVYTILGHKNFTVKYKTSSNNGMSTWKRLSMNKINGRRIRKW
jgi:sodium pump decarboxylase gamma subunit